MKINVRIEAVESKIQNVGMLLEAYRRESVAEIRRVEEVLSADFLRIESKVDLRLANMDSKLELMNERISLFRQLLPGSKG